VRAAVSGEPQLALWGEGESTGRLAGPRGRTFTEEQSAAIRAREGGRLLYANAGSGKTAVIVERFVLAVLEDGIDPRRILAITFTDKATGELRERLRERFLELDARGAARAAEGAHVSTIHGFCARLLRAHPFAAGIDPDFRVLDEAEGRRLRGDAFSAALARFLDSAARTGPAALELAAAYRPDRLAKLIDSTYTRLRSRGHTAPELPPVAPRLVPPAARERLACAHEALAARLAGAPANATVREAQDALDRCRVLLAADVHPMPAELDAACFKPRNVVALRLPETDEYLDAHSAYRAAVADSLAAEAWPLLSELMSEYGREYEERRRERSGLDFEDLELMTRDLLRDDPALRRAYSERFELLMIDEFQDTNARQLEILELLERDNLLTVGDEFQSIYGFRHADVELFRERRERLQAAGRAASLAANFRGRGPILDVINSAFSQEFGDGFVALTDGREDARELAGPLVELLVVDQRGWDDVDLGDLPPTRVHRQAEARALADRVARLVRDEGVAPGDVAVLVRALADLPVFERALEDQGLATYVTGARGYWSAQQVRDLVAYLSALANPRDELRVFQFLACPLGGVSSDGLAILAQVRRQLSRDAWWALEEAFCGGDGSAGLADALPSADAERLRELCPWFAAEREAAPRHALDELIERAIVARDYDLHALSLRNGARRYANVRKLLRLAREYETHEGRDLRGLLDWVARHEEADVPEPEAPVETEGMDAVRLMSIHAAKGLEFPVVCVADTGRQGPGSSDAPDLHVGEDGRVGLKVVSLDGKGVPALDWEPLQAEAQAVADAEERRIFYVAVTRARERLIVSGSVPKVESWSPPRSNGPPIAWLGPALAPGIENALTPEGDEWAAPNGVPVTVVTAAGFEPGEREGSDPLSGGGSHPPPPEPEPTRERPRALPVAALSYSSLEDYARCPYRFYLQRSLRLPAVEAPPEAREDDDEFPGRLRGTLTHLVLEELDFAHARAPEPGQIVALAGELGADVEEAHAAQVVTLVEDFTRTDLCRRLAGASEVKREAAFAFPLAAPGGDVLVNGVVDVIAREGERTLVVDYKSDRLEEDDDLVARAEHDYRTQRLVYALAVLRDGAAEVEVAHCFLERPDDPVSVTFGAAQAATLEAELAGLAAGILASEFPVSPTPNRRLCGTCPGRRALCSWEPEMTLRALPQQH
jgi:ATP-dependent helicase/nuclease subunit A